jgi:hypothetical protein
MSEYEETGLWKKSLGKINNHDDKYYIHYESLRNEYREFRKHASQLANEIARDLPDFTIHDASHFDKLWKLADLIAGNDFELNPMEAFVLGGSFLIHDLGLGLAAYPEGIDQLRREPNWSDTVAAILKDEIGHIPNRDEIQNADPEVILKTKEQILRNLHAKYAECLCLISWKENDHEYHLIDNAELREKYGTIIGKLAQSHWWQVSKLTDSFPSKIGSFHPYPQEWEIDPLKLACLLRVADASHIDSSRAPCYLRVIRKPGQGSRDHWVFQDHLHQPLLKNDRLVFTSGSRFPNDEASSWWLCFDTLAMIDRELSQVDALLSDSGRQRFAARGVANVNDAIRMAELIPTENWVPIDARIKITDISGLIKKFGGEELYGPDLIVPLRELIQNGSDAIRTRRIVEGRPNDWGDICVRTGTDSQGDWIEIEDTGIGMSTEVLTGPLLDFGSSYWGSTLMINEFPGLLSKGLQCTGKFGIGFFSVFMWGDHISVTTRRYDAAQRETQVLEFNCGLSLRPILRKATTSEILRDGGTRVRIWLKNSLESIVSSLSLERSGITCSLEDLCTWLCPSIDVNIFVEKENCTRKSVVRSSDWMDLDAKNLLDRVWLFAEPSKNYNKRDIINLMNNNLRPIYDQSGNVVARGCISSDMQIFGKYLSGVVTVGGLRAANLHGLAGIFIGNATKLSRDSAIPIANEVNMAKWASEQAKLICDKVKNPEDQESLSSIIRRLKGETGNLKVAYNAHGWINSQQIIEFHSSHNEILIIDNYELMEEIKKYESIKLNSNVIAVAGGIQGILGKSLDDVWLRPYYLNAHNEEEFDKLFFAEGIGGVVLESLAKSWGVTVEKILDASIYRDENAYEIGMIDGRPLKVYTEMIIRKPKN